MLAVANTGSCVGPQNIIGHPVHSYRQLMQVPVVSASGIYNRFLNMCCCFSGFALRNCGYNFVFFRERLMRFVKNEVYVLR